MADMGLHRLLREEEVLSDLAVHEPVRDELQDLDLARGRLLLELPERGGRSERNDRAGALRVPTCGSRLEATAVVSIPVEDLPPLRGVHALRIGLPRIAL